MPRIHHVVWIGLVLAAPAHGDSRSQLPPLDCDACAVQFGFVLNKAKYEVGEPITVTIRVSNIGSVPVVIPISTDVTGRDDGYVFAVTDAKGRVVLDPGAFVLTESLVSYVSIQPRTDYRRELTLNYQVGALEPARYFVRGVFAPRFPQRMLAESVRVPFEIVFTSSAQRRDRVSKLMRDLNGANTQRVTALLGFTGDSTALAPLVELLYSTDDATQFVASNALLYFDPQRLRESLLNFLGTRGPRDRLVGLLMRTPGVDPAEVSRVFMRWLASRNAVARAAAIRGLSLVNLVNRPPDQMFFGPLAAMLKDPVPRVRSAATYSVSAYRDAAALKVLKPLVHDSNLEVSEHATMSMGWVAEASTPDGETRKDAIDVLRRVAQSRRPSSRYAVYWLEKFGEQ